MHILLYTIATLALSPGFMATAQNNVALKTNLLLDAALSPNLAAEVGVAPRWSVEVGGSFNDWAPGGKQWKHWFVQPEVRYWLCERFAGHFFGAHLIGGEFNIAPIHNKRYQGRGFGAGAGYGFTHMLSRHWSIEAEIAVGWIRARYDGFPCATCGTRLETGKTRNYVGPTKAAVNLIYVF